jgi:hypothetical protein
MAKNCGLKKLLCPGGLLTGRCPFSRDDCPVYEESGGAHLLLGSTILTRIVDQIAQRDESHIE